MFRGLWRLLETIYDEGVKEWLDEERLTGALGELYVRLENGEIDEEAYERREEEILEQLRAVRAYKREHPDRNG